MQSGTEGDKCRETLSFSPSNMVNCIILITAEELRSRGSQSLLG